MKNTPRPHFCYNTEVFLFNRHTVTLHWGGPKLFVLCYIGFLNLGSPLREVLLYIGGVHTSNSFPKASWTAHAYHHQLWLSSAGQLEGTSNSVESAWNNSMELQDWHWMLAAMQQWNTLYSLLTHWYTVSFWFCLGQCKMNACHSRHCSLKGFAGVLVLSFRVSLLLARLERHASGSRTCHAVFSNTSWTYDSWSTILA